MKLGADARMLAAPCELLAWDTEFFGMRIARVTTEAIDDRQADAVLAWCRANSVACLYYLAPPRERGALRAVERRGFELVDVRIDLTCRLEDAAEDPLGDDAVRIGEPGDVEALVPVARASFGSTRFFFDEGFPRDRSAALYETWLERSFRGELADVVLVLDVGREPVAFVTCQISDGGEGRIGLLGVARAERGDRIGTRLCRSALSWFAGRGASVATVTTSGRNGKALQLYGRCGFFPTRVGLWYHRWFEPGD